MPWNTEVLLWVDQDIESEATGFAQGPAQSLHRAVKTWGELAFFAAEANFPEHHSALRPGRDDHLDTIKGVHDQKSLVQAFNLAVAESEFGPARCALNKIIGF